MMTGRVILWTSRTMNKGSHVLRIVIIFNSAPFYNTNNPTFVRKKNWKVDYHLSYLGVKAFTLFRLFSGTVLTFSNFLKLNRRYRSWNYRNALWYWMGWRQRVPTRLMGNLMGILFVFLPSNTIMHCDNFNSDIVYCNLILFSMIDI